MWWRIGNRSTRDLPIERRKRSASQDIGPVGRGRVPELLTQNFLKICASKSRDFVYNPDRHGCRRRFAGGDEPAPVVAAVPARSQPQGAASARSAPAAQ